MGTIQYDFSAAGHVRRNMEEMATSFRTRILAGFQDAEETLGTAFGGEAAILLQKKMCLEEEKLNNTYQTLKDAGEAMSRATRHARAVEEKAKQEILQKTLRD